MAQPTTTTAGIDTAKDKLDVAIHGQAGVIQVSNDAAGWERLASHLAQHHVHRVGIEATGGYERGVSRSLMARGLAVRVLQPLQVKAFGKLRLQRAKSDRIDAILIAACTHMIGDDDDKLAPDPRFDPLIDHLTFIEQIDDDIVRLKTRLEHISDKRLRRTVETDLRRLEARRTAELKRLTEALRRHPDLKSRFELVCSVPGIGPRTALAVVIRLPELGQISREQAAALAGLAPFVQQSGKWKGETHIGGGRCRLRRSLYAAALPASFRWNPALKDMYQRLTNKGKSHTSALVACARKLLIFANTVVARGTPWVKCTAAPAGA